MHCVQPTDTLVIASDGLWDVILISQHARRIGSDASLTNVADYLYDTALASRHCKDDVTILLARFNC